MLDIVMNKSSLGKDAKTGMGKAVSYLEKHKVDHALCIAAEVLSVAYLGIKTFQSLREKNPKKESNDEQEEN